VKSVLWPELLGQAWAALAVDADDDVPFPVRLEVTGDPGQLSSRLPVEDTAIACAGAALLAAASFAPHGADRGSRPARLDRGHVAAAFRSEAYLRLSPHAR
jgi:hypothetical protein